MSVETQVKAVGRSKVFWFVIGVIAGGTILALPVAMAFSFIRSKVPFFNKGSAEHAAAVAAGK